MDHSQVAIEGRRLISYGAMSIITIVIIVGII